MEALVAGETLTKEIHKDLTYNNLYDTIDHLWSLLLATRLSEADRQHTGYLCTETYKRKFLSRHSFSHHGL